MEKRIAVVVSVMVATLSGCAASAPPVEGNAADEEDVDTAAAAMTVIDNCATGSTANAIGSILGVGSTDSYTRPWQYIENICPSLDPANHRTTTVVDFNVSSANAWRYRFAARGAFWTATNPFDCEKLTAAARLQRKDKVTGAWEQVPYGYIEEKGHWVWEFGAPNAGHCDVPNVGFNRVNSESYTSPETYVYRVRAWAKQYDGTSFASMTITGENFGY